MSTPSYPKGIYEPQFTRPQPTEWPQLYGAVQEILPTRVPFDTCTIPDVERAIAIVDQLDTLTLERCYYYGLGPTVAGLSERLDNPLVQRRIVGLSASTILLQHVARCWTANKQPGRLTLEDVRPEILALPFKPLVTDVAQTHPAPHRLLVNVLGAVSNGRRFPHAKTSQPEALKEHIVTTDIAANTLTISTYAATSIVLQMAQIKLAKRGEVKPLVDYLGEDAIQRHFPLKAAKAFANIALAYILDGPTVKGIVEIDKAGNISCNHAKLPKRPSDFKGKTIANPRTEVLRCPARDVDELIPTVHRLLGSTVSLADAMVSNVEYVARASEKLQMPPVR